LRATRSRTKAAVIATTDSQLSRTCGACASTSSTNGTSRPPPAQLTSQPAPPSSRARAKSSIAVCGAVTSIPIA